jgi:hypothetical protein
VRDWVSSVVLYRLAKEHVHKAEGHASDPASSVGGRQREIDSCIATLVLVQAALESWIHWTAGQAGVKLSGRGLTKLWQQCDLIAEKAKRPPPPPLSEDDRQFLKTLSVWRNYHSTGTTRHARGWPNVAFVAKTSEPHSLVRRFARLTLSSNTAARRREVRRSSRSLSGPDSVQRGETGVRRVEFAAPPECPLRIPCA